MKILLFLVAQILTESVHYHFHFNDSSHENIRNTKELMSFNEKMKNKFASLKRPSSRTPKVKKIRVKGDSTLKKRIGGLKAKVAQKKNQRAEKSRLSKAQKEARKAEKLAEKQRKNLDNGIDSNNHMSDSSNSHMLSDRKGANINQAFPDPYHLSANYKNIQTLNNASGEYSQNF